MEVIAEIRRRHLVSGESISSIARDLKLSRPTVRKHLQTESEVVYQRQHQPAPQLGALIPVLESWLTTEHHLPKAQRRTAQRLFEGLQAEGHRGAYDSVQRFVRQWKRAQTKPAIKEAFVPLVFAPADACQFDWSQEHVEIGGVALTIKVAHFRLAYSRQMFVAAYPSETPLRQTSCRLVMMTNQGATRTKDGKVRSSIQEQGGGEVVAAGERRYWRGVAGGWGFSANT